MKETVAQVVLSPAEYERANPDKRLSHEGGYLGFYAPDHPLASKQGMVSLARYLASLQLGRWIQAHEQVLCDAENLTTEIAQRNLRVVTRAELMTMNDLHTGRSVVFLCDRPGCSEPAQDALTHYQRHARHYCNPACFHLDQRKLEISKEVLERLVWMIPTVKVAAILGVSDKAIDKRCKRLGITKPPRGYWAKPENEEADFEEVDAVLGAADLFGEEEANAG